MRVGQGKSRVKKERMTFGPKSKCHGDSDKRPHSPQLRAKHCFIATADSRFRLPDSRFPLTISSSSHSLPYPVALSAIHSKRTQTPHFASPSSQRVESPLPPLRDPDGPNDPMSLTNPPSTGSISARARTNLKRNLQSFDGKYLILGCCIACSPR